jgi:hypothetical protein
MASGLGCQFCSLRPCCTVDLNCCDAAHTAMGWTFDGRISMDIIRWPFYYFFHFGLIAAKNAPRGTMNYFLRGRSTNLRKGLAKVH